MIPSTNNNITFYMDFRQISETVTKILCCHDDNLQFNGLQVNVLTQAYR